MSSDRYVANGEKIMLGMVIWVDIDGPGGDKYEWGINVDGELNVAVFIPIQLELRLFLVVIKCFVVLFLLVLYLLLYHFINLTHPL